jgi:hypothetical protein
MLHQYIQTGDGKNEQKVGCSTNTRYNTFRRAARLNRPAMVWAVVIQVMHGDGLTLKKGETPLII